jgi:hypothetical protein
VRVKIRRGIDPTEWLREQELGGPIERTFDVATDGWSYEDGTVAYLEHIKGENRVTTYKDYKSCLNPKEFIERMDGHLSEKVINDALERVGLRFGPHDFQRALAQHGRMRKDGGPGLSLDQVRLITHPGEVDPENESLMGSYALDEFLEEKIDVMKRWCDWLDRYAIAAQRHNTALWLDVNARIQSCVCLLPTSLLHEKLPYLFMCLHPKHRVDFVFLKHRVPSGLINL